MVCWKILSTTIFRFQNTYLKSLFLLILASWISYLMDMTQVCDQMMIWHFNIGIQLTLEQYECELLRFTLNSDFFFSIVTTSALNDPWLIESMDAELQIWKAYCALYKLDRHPSRPGAPHFGPWRNVSPSKCCKDAECPFSRLTPDPPARGGQRRYRRNKWLQPLLSPPVPPDYPHIVGHVHELGATLSNPFCPPSKGKASPHPFCIKCQSSFCFDGGWCTNSDSTHTAVSLPVRFHISPRRFSQTPWPLLESGQPRKMTKCLAKHFAERPQAWPNLAVSYLPEQEKLAWHALSWQKKVAVTLTQTGLHTGSQNSCLVMLSGSFLETESKLSRLQFLDFTFFPTSEKAGTAFARFLSAGAWLSL